MINKPFIKETIVVEGKTDLNKIKRLFNANVITTNGSDCTSKTINIIKKCNEKNGVILFLDPDYVGEQIRKKISNQIPNAKHAFIDSKFINVNKPKNGIAEMSDQIIINALNNVITLYTENNSISLNEFNSFQINSKNKRINICNNLNISYCNNKQLFRRLNMLGINAKQLEQIINNANNKK